MHQFIQNNSKPSNKNETCAELCYKDNTNKIKQ